MKTARSFRWCLLLPVAFGMAPRAQAQAVPSGASSAPTIASSGPTVGFGLPTTGGSLSYGLTASELLSKGFYQNNNFNAFTNFSGNVAMVTRNELHPFSAVYSGGYYFGTTNAPSSFFQSLSFSQVLNTKHWNIVASDSVSYLPSSPTLGLSGVPGVGDLGVAPVQVGPQGGLGILTNYGPRVSNVASLSLSRRLTGHVSLQGNGSYSLLRYIGDNSQYGLNTTGYNGGGGATYTFNARSSMALNYSYSHYSYVGSPFAFDTHSGTIGYNRALRRDLTFSVYAGPLIAVSTQPGLNYNSGLSVTAGASLGYQRHPFNYSLQYGRGISGGSGVIPGAVNDNAGVSASRQFGRAWSTSASLNYSHNTSLPQFSLVPFSSNSLSAGIQANRSLTRSLSAFASYSAVRQGTSGSLPVNTFSGYYQVVGFGLTYSPAPLNLGR